MIDSLLKNNLCTGCGLCNTLFKDKISLDYNEQGYIRPIEHQKLNTQEKELFNKICPGLNSFHFNPNGLFGESKSIYTAYSTNSEIRFKGSSGGVLTATAKYLLEQKKVDCIIHVGAHKNTPWKNQTKYSFSVDEVIHNSGSRYAPSSPLEDIQKYIVEQNLKIAVIAKPCDIQSLRQYQKLKLEGFENIKYLLSFMCAGIPSIDSTKKIIHNFNLKSDDVKSLNYRGEGWPGYFKIITKNLQTHKITYNESWGTVLNQTLQHRCKICADGTGESADIACGDAWESNDGYPSFEEKAGESLVLSRTNLGERILSEMITNHAIQKSKRIISEKNIETMQPYQVSRKKGVLPRVVALKIFGKTTPKYDINSLLKLSLNFKNIPYFMKNFIGMVRRIVKN